MIDNNERGININKTLTWTMLVSVTGLIWWGGGTLASLQSAAEWRTLALPQNPETDHGRARQFGEFAGPDAGTRNEFHPA